MSFLSADDNDSDLISSTILGLLLIAAVFFGLKETLPSDGHSQGGLGHALIIGMTPREFSLVLGLNGLGIVLTTQVAGRLSGEIAPCILLTFGLFIAITGRSYWRHPL